MDINDEITGTEEMIALDRGNAVDVLAKVAPRLSLHGQVVEHYQNFIDACIASASSILAQCRAIAAMPDVPPDVATKVIEPLLLCPHEATRSMYLGMLVIEQLVTPTGSSSTTPVAPRIDTPSTVIDVVAPDNQALGPDDSAVANDTQPTCSFCGKTATETPVVAAPVGGICAACTRLAAAIHGIAIAD